jgi:hypothetical protein
MADQSAPAAPAAPAVVPALLLYTLARLGVVAALVGLLWALGLPGTAGFLFGLLLAMPVSYLLLRPLRDRLTAALIARSEAKEALRTRLSGSDVDD